MMRVYAALLACVVTVVLFAAALALANWLAASAWFWRGLNPKFIAVGIAVFNNIWIVPLAVRYQRRAKRDEEDEPLTPLHRWRTPIGRRGL